MNTCPGNSPYQRLKAYSAIIRIQRNFESHRWVASPLVQYISDTEKVYHVNTYSDCQEDRSSPVSVQVTHRVMIIVGKPDVRLGFSKGYAGTESSSPPEFDLMRPRKAVLIY